VSAPVQLPLDLALGPSYAGDDFLIAACNRAAVAWLRRWPDWPAPLLVVHGPPGCGKTHLLRAFLARTGGRAITPAALAAEPPERLLADAGAGGLDDLEPVLAAGLEEPLLHLVNVARERDWRLVVTAATAPARLAIALPDLRSRLPAAPAVGIGAPDEATLRAVLAKLFHDRRLAVDDALLGYVLLRMDRSFAGARDVVARLDRASLAARRPVSVALARAVLADAD